MLAGPGRQAVQDHFFGHRLQQTIALHAAFERLEGAEEVEAADDLQQLPLRVGVTNAVAVRHDPPLDEAPITGQEDAALVAGDAGQFSVLVIVRVEGVEAEHAKVASQRAEVNVTDKARDAERFGSDAQDGRDVEGLKDGVDTHVVTVLEVVGEVDGLAVDEN